MKISRIVVGKGVTHRPSADEEVWTKTYIELEAQLAKDEKPEAVKDALLAMLDQWMENIHAGEQAKAMPKLDLAEIESLKWTRYKDKQRAEPGDAAWTFSDPARHDNPEQARIVAELTKAIRQSPNQKLELGQYIFSFSGDNNQFISRRPKK